METMIYRTGRFIIKTIVFSSFILSTAIAGDWPNWRGPNHDGISTETGWFKPGSTLVTLWSHEVGAGYSSMAVTGNRIYTMGNADNKDAVWCLDADSGAVIWEYSYTCKAESYPGPRATPAVNENRVYTFSRAGDLLCLDATTGKLVWLRELQKDQSVAMPGWGFASSPLIYKNMVIVNAGSHGMAFDKITGKNIWQSDKGGASYATPVPFLTAGQDSVAIFAAKGINGVMAATGELLWKFDWKTDYDVHAAVPVFITDNQAFISSGYNRGGALLRINGDKVEKIWENKNLCSHFSSPVLHEGVLYGINGNTGGGETRCIDPLNGTMKWRTKDPGFGSLMLADGKLIILGERGLLVIAEANSSEYKELFRKQILSGTCWTAPVLAHGKIYSRNHPGKLLCMQFK